MTPIPMRAILISVATFCGVVIGVVMLGKLVTWITGVDVAAWSVVAAAILGAGCAIAAGASYACSVEVEIEEQRMRLAAQHDAERRQMFAKQELREAQAALGLPAKSSDVTVLRGEVRHGE